MIKVSIGNFLIVTVMAILGILLLKSLTSVFPVKGLSQAVHAV